MFVSLQEFEAQYWEIHLLLDFIAIYFKASFSICATCTEDSVYKSQWCHQHACFHKYFDVQISVIENTEDSLLVTPPIFNTLLQDLLLV